MRRCLGILLLVSTLSSSASAQSEDAKKYFNEGRRAFDLGEFDKAIDKWQKAYELKADPSFLYNIAQAYRQKPDPHKAIFFYKSYLRNSPDARNRAEVEEKIAALQKVLDDQARTKEMPPPGPLSPDQPAEPTHPPATTVATTTPATTAKPVETSPSTSTTSAPPPVESVTTHATPTAQGAVDLGVSAGVDVWAAGGPVDPSLGLSFTGGYRLAALSTDTIQTRIGLRIGLTFVSEANTDTFASFLVDPMVSFTLIPDRLSLVTELGVGFLIIDGLTPRSVFLSGSAQQVTGALSSFELRPAVGIAYSLTPSVALSLLPAIIYSPQPTQYFVESSIVRFEIPVGVAFRF